MEDNLVVVNSPQHIADDLLYGARQIALFVFSKDDEKHCKKIFYWVSRRRIPVFHMAGGGIWARKSVLLAWIAEQEQKSLR